MTEGWVLQSPFYRIEMWHSKAVFLMLVLLVAAGLFFYHCLSWGG